MDLSPHLATLRRLARTDPDPRVRHRADALALVAAGLTLAEAARLLGRSRTSLRSWRGRFLAEGGAGLADRGRRGRPPKLGVAARRLLADVLDESPLDHGYPVTTWTVADLADLLGRRGWAVSGATVNRTLHALGYRYRRPRHDLTHRQDAEAVASAKHALAELQKRGLLPGLDSASSTWTSATSTSTPTWRRFGSAGARR
jgi:putative transposase